MVGSNGSGKSCLLLRFTQNTFSIEHETTIGVDFSARTVETKGLLACIFIGIPFFVIRAQEHSRTQLTTVAVFVNIIISIIGNKLRLHIWDTAGQESFQSVARGYYRDAAAAILVYDISNRQSFEQLPKWLAAVREHAGNRELTITLVGNKSDQPRSTSREEAEAFARYNNLMFHEVSAKTGDGVNAAFMATAGAILRKIDQGALIVDDPSSGVRHTDRRSITPVPPIEINRSGSAHRAWCCSS